MKEEISQQKSGSTRKGVSRTKTSQRGYSVKDKRYQIHEILGGKACIVQVPRSPFWQFRCWIASENKYFRVSLKTDILKDAIYFAEEEYMKIRSLLSTGRRVFALTFGELIDLYLARRKDDVESELITQQRYETLKTQCNRWIAPYFSKTKKINELNQNTFYDYANYRRKMTQNTVRDVTIRNEQTTIGSIIQFANREGLLNLDSRSMNYSLTKLKEVARRDSFDVDEYRIFYRKLREFVKLSKGEYEKYNRMMFQDFCLIKANTFMRFGEITQLKWNMVTIFKEQGTELVTLDLPKEICKNRKTRKVTAKGGQYFMRVKSYSNFTKKNDYVFSCIDKPSRQVNRTTLYKLWNEFMMFCNFDNYHKKFSFYSLRHFGITMRIYSKVNIYDLSKMAGTNISHIENHYDHSDISKDISNALKNFKYDKKSGIIEPTPL